VKSIACRQDRTVLEIRRQTGEAGPWAQALIQLCQRNGLPAELIGEHRDAVFLAIGNDLRYEKLQLDAPGCVQVHLRPQRAILSLVGEGIAEMPGIAERALAALKRIPATVVVAEPDSERTISLIVPQAALERSAGLLHAEFFRHPDPVLFAECPQPAQASYTRAKKQEKQADWRKEQARRLVLVRQN
jgi:aspartokinase